MHCDSTCGACASRYFTWLKRHTSMRKRVVRGVGRGTQAFYEYAATSVKPETPDQGMTKVWPRA
jgi:hypothetical protein